MEALSSVRRTSPLTSPVLTTMQPSLKLPETLYSPGEAIVTTLPSIETPPPETSAPVPVSVMTLMPPPAISSAAAGSPAAAVSSAGAGVGAEPISISPQPVNSERHSAQTKRRTNLFFITAYPYPTRVRR